MRVAVEDGQEGCRIECRGGVNPQVTAWQPSAIPIRICLSMLASAVSALTTENEGFGLFACPARARESVCILQPLNSGLI